MIKIFPCKWSKSEGNKFLGMEQATIKNIGCELAGSVTARYYKGISSNNDNCVLVINYDSDVFKKG